MLAVGIVGSVFLGAVQDRAVGESLQAHDAVHGTELHASYFTLERRGLFGRYRSLDETRVATADAATQGVVAEVVADSKRTALRYVAVLPLLMLVAYLLLIVYFRRRGGYAAVDLPAPAAASPPS
jgi:hypothetical protein